MNDETMMELVREVRADVRNLKDNHLKHMEADMADLKADVRVIVMRVDSIEEFTGEIESFIRKYSMRAIMIVLSTGGLAALMM